MGTQIRGSLSSADNNNAQSAFCDSNEVMSDAKPAAETVRLMKQAVSAHNEGNLQLAEAAYRQVTAIEPRHGDAFHLLGVIAFQKGHYQDALQTMQEALKNNPSSAAYNYTIGNVYRAQGAHEKAIKHYEQALRCNPRFADAHFSMGNIYLNSWNFEKAIDQYRSGLALDSANAKAYYNLGTALLLTGRREESLKCHLKAVALKPDYALALNSAAALLSDAGLMSDAIAHYKAALQHNPEYADVWSNIGNALVKQGKLEEGYEYYHRALQLSPDHRSAYSNLLLNMHYHPDLDPEYLLNEHCEWARSQTRMCAASRRSFNNNTDKNRRLRIGYVSMDFRNHAVASFLRPVMAAHDHQRFEVWCYSDVPVSDDVTLEFSQYTDHWRTICNMSDSEVADRIRSDGIDILVDLAGHSGGNRLRVFARKPAPVQVTWLGYPDTTGLPEMDYRITDHLADPGGKADQLHTETLYRMPGGFLCFQASYHSPKVGNLPFDNTGTITFGSCNNIAKVNYAVAAAWAAVLKQVPKSRLLIKSGSFGDADTRKRFEELFRCYGIGPEQLELACWSTTFVRHLAVYNRIDIALDPFPYNGTTTTCEALWMGVPVITLAGDRHCGRVGTSLLTTIGLSDMIAASREDYIEMAVRLASAPEKLRSIRSSLRGVMQQSRLCDAEGFTARIEQAYRDMWQQWVDGQKSATVDRDSAATGTLPAA